MADREGLELLLDDLAEHQRRAGREVTATSNQAIAAQAFEQLERRNVEDKPQAPAAPSAPDLSRLSAPGRVNRDGQHGRYVVDKSSADDCKVRKANRAEQWFMEHALPRIELLLTKKESGPLGSASWYQRVLAVLELKSRVAGLRLAMLHGVANDLERRFFHELLELLEASSAAFGDWKKDASNPLVVGWTPSKD